MAILSIPEPIIDGLTAISRLTDDEYQDLFNAYTGLPLKLHQYTGIESSDLKVTVVSSETAKEITDTLIPLYFSRIRGQVEISKFVGDILETLQTKTDELEWLVDENIFTAFTKRLSELLTISSVQTILKSRDVLMEHAQTFGKIRVVSDIRTVFGDNLDEPPSSAVIVHMLNITFQKGGISEEFVVALDTKDIQLIMDACERAKAKTKHLESVINSTELTYIEVI